MESVRGAGARSNLSALIITQLAAPVEPTDNYLVNAEEGRRLAQLLRVKRKEIKADEPIRCILDIEHSSTEISSAENAIRSARYFAENARYQTAIDPAMPMIATV